MTQINTWINKAYSKSYNLRQNAQKMNKYELEKELNTIKAMVQQIMDSHAYHQVDISKYAQTLNAISDNLEKIDTILERKKQPFFKKLIVGILDDIGAVLGLGSWGTKLLASGNEKVHS